MVKTKKVIFATRNEHTARSFERHVRYLGKENDDYCFFELFQPDSRSAIFTIKETPNELIRLLEDNFYDRLSHTVVILDYASLYDDFQLFVGERLSPIARLFLSYPEITLWVLRIGKKSRPLFEDSGFLAPMDRTEPKTVEPVERYHHLVRDLNEVLQFGSQLKGSRSLFDPSGIRNFIKVKMLEKIKFESDNFEGLHSSRRDRMAMTLDEEPRHALFWAYTLYNFGYSVLPVVTYSNLKSLMTHTTDFDLICRDYDLQFPDLPDDKDEQAYKLPLHLVRGVIEKKANAQDINTYQLNLKKPDNVDEPFYWEKFFKGTKAQGMFISQLPISDSKAGKKSDLKIVNPDKEEKELKHGETFPNYGIIRHEEEVKFRGFSKEINGMYEFLRFPEVKDAYENSRSGKVASKKREDVSDHSIPAINSSIAYSLIDRGKISFKNEQYLEAALLASEALEVLNGLSMSASMEAFHLKCCAEVKLELSVIGVGNFNKVVKKRIFEIRRLLYRMAENNDEARRNAKMKIFNDLRKIYEEHEQSDAADTVYNEVIKAELEIKDPMSYKIRDNITHANKKAKEKGTQMLTGKWKNSLKYLTKFTIHAWNFWVLIILGILMTSNYFVTISNGTFSYYVETYGIFPWLYLVFFLVIILVRRKKLIYLIIGAGCNFIRLFSTFIAFNLIIFFMYWLNFGRHFKKIELLFSQTWVTSFINEPFQLLDSRAMQSAPIMIYILVIIHVIASVFYLGVLISALYRWFVRR